MATKIRKCDEGTDYAAALIAGNEAGPANATDAQMMAMYCEYVMQLVVGAFSPRLVREGAQNAGLTTLELNELCVKKDFAALDDLQWS